MLQIDMPHWKDVAEILTDVVYFNYRDQEVLKTYDEVFVWDLDKTYLDTHWGTLRELFNTAFEKAFQKRNVPGTRSLVRALMEDHQKKYTSPFPIFFITASPPFLEKRIKEKLDLDGLYPLGIFFKDNLKNIHPKRFWRLRQQVGYKVQALLQLRLSMSENLKQVMWGDDSEADAIIYSLYSDICMRRHSTSDLRELLRALHVTGKQLDVILDLQSQIPISDPIEKIYINLADDTDPEYYLKFGRRLVATTSTFQASLDLCQDGRLSPDQVVKVGQDLTMNYGFSRDELRSGLDDLVRRQILGAETLEEVLPYLQKAELLPEDFCPSVGPVQIHKASGLIDHERDEATEPWIPERIDYLHDYR